MVFYAPAFALAFAFNTLCSLSLTAFPMKPTLEQVLAQSADRHLAVTAGAGAGKTTALVDRFLHLLLNKRVDVRNITAITFTRKAASEMQSRLAAKVDSLLADPTRKADWERIKRVRERLTSANISTIHSFCARLLREYPIEAGVNPNFSEMQEYEVRLLRERAIARTLEEWLDVDVAKDEQAESAHTTSDAEEQAVSQSASRHAAKQQLSILNYKKARRLWNTLGKQNLHQMLREILQSSEIFVELRDLYATTTDAEILARRDAMIIPAVATSAHAYLTQLGDAIEQTIDFSVLNPKNASTQHLAQAQGVISIAKRTYAGLVGMNVTAKTEAAWQEIEHLIENVEAARKLACKNNGAVSSNGIKAGIKDAALLDRMNADLVESYKQLEDVQQIVANRAFDAELLELARILVEIASDAFEYVQQEKDRRGALDFDDLQMKADALLSNPDVQARVRTNIKFLMMDEFQDTNELQYRIAQKVITMWGTEALPQAGWEHSSQNPPHLLSPASNLFIVGDPKQSIYRFRGADVRVFGRAKEEIERTNRALLAARRLLSRIETPNGFVDASSEAQTRGLISLATTFRLAPVVAAFVNRVCGHQMRRMDSEFDVEYEDIICGIGTTSPVRGSVTMLVARGRANEKNKSATTVPSSAVPSEDEEEHTSEAELLAAHIRHIVEDAPVLVREGSAARPAQYGDVFVLARSRSGFDDLTKAFRRAGIPFFVSGGRGYYARQEMLDMRAIMLFLQNTSDDISCAAVLRSPMFTITDDELYRISRCGGASFWERADTYFKQYKDSVEELRCSEAFLRAHSTLTTLLPLASRLTIPSLIRTIIEQTGWRGVIAADERFEQIEANIEKLLELARGFENQGFRNLYDFAEELRILAEHSINEGEAEVVLGKNAVTMMTIHASKGLEAPIVVLYNANGGRSKNRSQASIDGRLGLAFKLQRADEDGTLRDCPTPLHALLSSRAVQAEIAETKRLLYVALTRAKDHIVISSKINEKKNAQQDDNASGALSGGGFLNMIVQGLGREHLNLLHEINIVPDAPHTLRVLEDGALGQMTLADEEVKISIVHEPQQYSFKRPSEAVQEQSSSTTDRTRGFAFAKPLLLAPMDAAIEGDVYSASQLRLFAQDPDEYERVYRLGLLPDEDEALPYSRFEADDDDERAVGTSAGTTIHAVLHHLPKWMNADGTLNDDELRSRIRRAVPDYRSAGRNAQELAERVFREARAVAQTPLVRRYAERLRRENVLVKYEYALSLPFDHTTARGTASRDILIGTLDVMVKNERGEWEIWDWKTNRVASHNEMGHLVEDYHLQMEMYAFLLAHVAPEQQNFTARLLFTRRAAPTALDQDWTRTVEFSRQRIEAIRKRISSLILDIRAVSYGELA
jgi:ATP-dependent helicase/nuclease subunit A